MRPRPSLLHSLRQAAGLSSHTGYIPHIPLRLLKAEGMQLCSNTQRNVGYQQQHNIHLWKQTEMHRTLLLCRKKRKNICEWTQWRHVLTTESLSVNVECVCVWSHRPSQDCTLGLPNVWNHKATFKVETGGASGGTSNHRSL